MDMKSYRSFAMLLLVGCVAGCVQRNEPVGVPMVTRTQQARWDSKEIPGVAITSEHYRIYTTSNNRALVRYMPGFMEAAYRNYLTLTGLRPRRTAEPMPIYLMADRKQWALLTRAIVGGRNGPQNSIEAGGYCFKGVCVFWDLGGLATFSVAAHEGLHQFFAHQLRDRLPMWLEEGLCVTAEGYEITGDRVLFTPDRNVSRFSDLRNAIVQGYWIPIRRLLPMHSMDAVGGYTEKTVGYYGQLWALVRFLRSQPQYKAGMQQLLRDAQAGRLDVALGMPSASLDRLRARPLQYNRTVSIPLFRRYITSDLENFERQYFAFAKKITKLQ